MFISSASSQVLIWNSNDLLVRAHHGEAFPDAPRDDSPPKSESRVWDEKSASPLDLPFDARSLGAIESDSARFESLSAVRSDKPSSRHVQGFAARNNSTWALDVLVSRFTGGRHDWASLRSAAIRFAALGQDFEPTLDQIKLEDLWALCEALHARGFDHEAEHGLLQFIATRILEGRSFDTSALESLMENLLNADLGELARALLPRLDSDTWIRHALAVDLEHPRFGGSYDGLLRKLNEAYRRFGLEPISLEADGDTPFQRLTTPGTGTSPEGPLISIIMTSWCPGPEIFTAVRSIIGQTYQNWELILTDDASPDGFREVLEKVEILDSRIRLIHNTENVGTYVRRNEAMSIARGGFVTMQDSDDWSHPRRLELQLRDLLSTPGRFANVVRAARVTDAFSLVSPRGARLFLSEPSILFRRGPVLDVVGYFDTTRRGADTEFRQRLELATGVRVPLIGPEIPLELMRAEASSLSGADFGKTLWTAPTRLAYRSSIKRFHDRIRTGIVTPRLSFPQEKRVIHAPARLTGAEASPQQFDVLVVADGHGPASRSTFIETLTSEIQTATSAGLRVALLHSDSVTGARNAGPLAKPLQVLIDTGRISRVFLEDEVEADLVVVRNAGALQGHVIQRHTITTHRVIVVEDAVADDQRGVTVAKPDVVTTAAAWFGVTPEWAIAKPVPPPPSLVSAITLGDGSNLRVTLRAQNTSQIETVRLIGTHQVDSEAAPSADGVLHAHFTMAELPSGDITLAIVRRSPLGGIIQQTIRIRPQTVVTIPAERMIVPTLEEGLRLIEADSTMDGLTSDELVSRYLSASITLARIFRQELEVSVLPAPETALSRIYGLREIDGKLWRREFTILNETDQGIRATRNLEKLVGLPWRLFATFVTPLGPVDAPLDLLDSMETRDSSDYRIRRLNEEGLGLLHVEPQEATRATVEPPLLSVIMPVFNVGPYLDTAIRSVLTQTFSDLELIIVNDASTDNSGQIIEMHRKLDSRVRVIDLKHNTLGGAGLPSNLGIRAARGRYLGLVDSDDWATRDIFSNLVALAENHDAQLVLGDFHTFNDKDRSIEPAYDSEAWRDIPLDEVISAYTHPALLRLSPVPWRKLYRRSYLIEHDILYPEGDYFYEDNPLHWFALSRADRVVATDEITSFHRMEREGQTMGANQYKLGAVVSHANTILNYLTRTDHHGRETLFIEFFAYLRRQQWAVKRQQQDSASMLIQRGLADIYSKAIAEVPRVRIDDEIRAQFERYSAAYRDIDLTIVIPVFNGADLLPELLDSVLRLNGLSYNVLIVDDGSTDTSYDIMTKYAKEYSNIHVFHQHNRGAGRARNSVIPLITARYTYFLDSDDVIDPDALRSAIQTADEKNSDLLFTKYRLEYVDEGRTGPMFKSDIAIWEELGKTSQHEERQKLASALINYPWNRVIRTSLLHDSNIFFGPTVVHNDILFHWHSTLAATSISVLDVEVCTHRKFKGRPQVTNIVDDRRMAVLDALDGTYHRISQLESYENAREEWERFSLNLIQWARERTPRSLHETYDTRSKALTANFQISGGLHGALQEQSQSGADDIRRLRNWVAKLKETIRAQRQDIERLRNWNTKLKNKLVNWRETDSQLEGIIESRKVENPNDGEQRVAPEEGASPATEEPRQQASSPSGEQPS